jgi:hypothetical protein
MKKLMMAAVVAVMSAGAAQAGFTPGKTLDRHLSPTVAPGGCVCVEGLTCPGDPFAPGGALPPRF